MKDTKSIVLLRYGSLTDYSKVCMTITNIGRRLFIPRSTVDNLLRRFDKRGQCFDTLKKKKEKFTCIPAEVKKHLIDPKLL